MQEQATRDGDSVDASTTRYARLRVAAMVGLALLCVVVLPVVPILLGIFLILTAALHAASPEVRPYVQPLLRVPVAGAGRRRVRLLLAAGVGALLVVSGSVGATIRGHLRGEWQRHEEHRAAGEQHVVRVWARVEECLAAGDVGGAQLALLDVETLDLDPETRARFDDLLLRLNRCSDPVAILDLVIHLPQADFEALHTGAYVPDSLEFGDPALTRRALEHALAQLDVARQARARP